MKSPIKIIVIPTMLFALAGCIKNSSQSGKARADAEAKVRADASRREMETLPKVFRTPEYFKKNESSKAPSDEGKADMPKK